MSKERKQMTIAVAATFTAELIREPLDFWFGLLGLSASVEFAPYNQVLQELLNPTGLLGGNTGGINLILLRLQDWERYTDGEEQASTEKAEQHATEFINALKAAAERSPTPIIVCFCSVANEERSEFFQSLETLIRVETAGLSHVHILNEEQVLEHYPVEAIFDPRADRLGHIPFTTEYFTALGTVLTRKMYSLLHVPYKVLALDCDNTLWRGVCGEGDVEIDSPYRSLQEFALRQSKEGLLICLCSKNEEGDVQAVFDSHGDQMPLSMEDVVSAKINWESKSSNLLKTAEDLNLGIDSFIFLDDSPLECAEVRANCPGALSLQLPENEQEIPSFLQHVWAFDRIGATAEDATRTELYRRNARREAARAEQPTFAGFIQSLELSVQIGPMRPEQLARVAQLTQRTNQFNASTIRRSEKDVQSLHDAGAECLTVVVSDRFGDYGLVGVMIFKAESDTLVIDTFLLSCRALGRGVEYQMLAELIRVARERDLEYVEIIYSKTEKNEPVYKWLEKTGHRISTKADPPKFIPEEPAPTKDKTAVETVSVTAAPSEIINRIATELRAVSAIMAAMRKPVEKRDKTEGLVAPRNPDEVLIAAIWCDLLGIDRVGVTEDFFELGGHSLLMVEVVSRIAEESGTEIPMQAFLESPTVESLARASAQWQEALEPDVLDLVNEIEELSEEEVAAMLDKLEKGE